MASFKDIIVGTAGIPATCTITSDESDFTDATPFEIQIEFSKSVTGFVVGDITINNASLSNFAGSGTSYTADVTPDLTDDITISVAADVTNEGNSASNTVTVTDNYVIPQTENGFRADDVIGKNSYVTVPTEIASTGGDNNTTVRGVDSSDSNLRYFEIEFRDYSQNGPIIGVSAVDNRTGWLGSYTGTVCYRTQDSSTGKLIINMVTTNHPTVPGMQAGDIMRVWVKNNKVWMEFYSVGGSFTYMFGGGNPYTDTSPTAELAGYSTLYPAVSIYHNDDSVKIKTISPFTVPPSAPAIPLGQT